MGSEVWRRWSARIEVILEEHPRWNSNSFHLYGKATWPVNSGAIRFPLTGTTSCCFLHKCIAANQSPRIIALRPSGMLFAVLDHRIPKNSAVSFSLVLIIMMYHNSWPILRLQLRKYVLWNVCKQEYHSTSFLQEEQLLLNYCTLNSSEFRTASHEFPQC